MKTEEIISKKYLLGEVYFAKGLSYFIKLYPEMERLDFIIENKPIFIPAVGFGDQSLIAVGDVKSRVKNKIKVGLVLFLDVKTCKFERAFYGNRPYRNEKAYFLERPQLIKWLSQVPAETKKFLKEEWDV